MSPEIAAKIVQLDYPNALPHEQMLHVNALVRANDSQALPVFAEVDIVFTQFLDHLVEFGNQRERDLVVVSEKLQRCWKILHISWQTLGEKPHGYDLEDVRGLVQALKRLNLMHLLTKDLTVDLDGLLA